MIAGGKDTDGLLGSVCDGLRQFVDTPRVAIWHVDEGRQNQVLRHVNAALLSIDAV